MQDAPHSNVPANAPAAGPPVELNAPQAEAVAHASGPLLVFAGAGSGKTRVITYRIANLVARERVAPWRILAVTFTNKAAGEMRHRLENPALLGPVARDLWVGTFHATCAKFLRMFPEAIERTKSFVIYDTTDQKAVVTRVLRDMNLDDRRYSPKSVLGRIHKEKQEGRGPADMQLDSYLDDAIQKAYTRYEAALRSANALDFEDLILSVVRIMEAPTDGSVGVEVVRARDALEKKFEFILVDEFQDTNQIQYRLLKRLAARTKNLCVVGDDDQSIYRWRGADVRNIRYFRRDWPDAKVVKLEQNYRSTKNIVSSALAVIAPSATREPKDLWTDNDDGSAIRVITCADERDEAACVVRAIRDAREAGISPKEIAVFYRVHAQSRVLEEGLRAVNLPYQIVGGTKFYDRAEIKDALAYLRVLVNPRSDVDLLRIINTPARGIGNTTVERLATYATTQRLSLFEALGKLEDFAEDLGSAAKKRLGQFRELMSLLTAEAKDRPAAEVLRILLAKSGYKKALEEEDTAEAEGRLENLAELEGSMSDYEIEAEARGEVPTLEGFLERVSLVSDTDNLGDVEKVTLMTVHGAKGLEFELVLLTGMEEDMFPYRNQEPRSPEEMEEERRLAYVAITRARHHLIVTHGRQRQIFGTTRLGVPSRFIGDLPPNVIEHLETAAARAAGGGGRWIDRGSAEPSRSPRPSTAPSSWRHPHNSEASRSSSTDEWGAGPAAWRQDAPSSRGRSSAPPSREPGERFVDYDEAGDTSQDVPLRRGSTVVHERFGRGEVMKIVTVGEPAVVAFFPGWGEKKVLARFLKLA
ncbi:MAG TPA: UvrD-helicase domain-containing protein [Labilithrix sp.]|nr:UvrD-helicase domain-containing protein [Labilithrix sp.]